MRARPFDWTALTLAVIGAINWGLIGFIQFDLIAALFGGVDSLVSRIVYAIIGLAGLYCIGLYGRIHDHGYEHDRDREHNRVGVLRHE
jgi:uncharacterized membrane protein YuzA (DUF378 family)